MQAEEELSEEDQQLKENLEMMVERAKDPVAEVQKMAITSIATEIKTSTSSMTSVPKPLKFLRPHYDGLKATLGSLPAGSPNAADLADVISVLAMTSSPEGSRETLRYKLQAGGDDVSRWGHEYIRRLAAEIGEEHEERLAAEPPAGVDDLMALVARIVPWDMAHNAEPEAVDLCLEVGRLDLLGPAVDEGNCARTCLYLLACAAYLPEPEDDAALRAAFRAYEGVGRHADALRVALQAGDRELAAAALAGATDPVDKKQLAHMMAGARWWVDLEGGPAAVEDEALREELAGIMG